MRTPEGLRDLGRAILVAHLLLPIGAGAAETLHVPLATCGGVQTAGSYSGHVRLTVSSWGTYSPGVDAMDAFYKLSIGDNTTSAGLCAPCFRYARVSEGGCTCGSECPESKAVSSHILETYPSFNPSHEYSVTLDLGAAPADRLSFGISDCGCFDNSGELVVTVEPEPLPNICGDGIVEGTEQCDDGNTSDGDCCSATCELESSATVCRGAAGVCDQVENCSGTNPLCPPDTFASNTIVCRAAVDTCDIQENCTGAQADCPVDVLAPSTQECRPTAGPCDVAENCSGVDTACPSDSFAPPVIECRGAAGICDAAESCTGSDSQCPADSFATASQECRPVAGPCDLPEVCTGSSADCPSDSLASQGTPCRSAAGQCDEPEACTGDTADCPADAKAANTTVCRATTGTCDAAEYCDGTGNTCPIDSGPPACGISDFCCPGTCGAAEDPDCCSNSITFSNCQIKPSIAVGKPDKYRVSCSVLDATASTNGLHLDTDPLWLVIRDATTSPAACLEELLSPGPCTGDVCDTGTFELESCSEDRDCRPCRQTGNGFLCKGKPRTPGISKVALKLLRDGSGRRYKLVLTGSTTDIQCSFASLPWSLGIVQGDDCGDVACTQIDGSRISCPGAP